MSLPVGVPQRMMSRWRRGVMVLTVGFGVLLLAGCSAEDKDQLRHFAMPGSDPRNVTSTSHWIFDLWKWGWVAAMVTGVITWALIFYAAWAFRRRSDDDVPVQTRYNLPLEIFYTIAPVIMVVVFFFHTVQAQNAILEEVDNPDHTIEVVGQQWQWTFNYPDEDAVDAPNVYEYGTAYYRPTLVLPVDETTQFNLHSPDVVHSFWITGFLMKMDVIPGKVNHFQITPTQIGDFRGKCAELCGVSHSRMLFDVKVVSREDYDAWLQGLEDKGNISEEPLLGGTDASTQHGLDTSESGEGE